MPALGRTWPIGRAYQATDSEIQQPTRQAENDPKQPFSHRVYLMKCAHTSGRPQSGIVSPLLHGDAYWNEVVFDCGYWNALAEFPEAFRAWRSDNPYGHIPTVIFWEVAVQG